MRLLGGLFPFARSAFAGTDHVERTVRGDAVEPGAEAGPFVEFRKLPVGAQEGFLHHVFSVFLMSRHTIGETEQIAAVTFHEDAERSGIPGARLRDCHAIAQFHQAIH